MKIVVYYLIAVYTGVIFLSIYSCIADMIIDSSLSIVHLQHLISYMVYFILYKTWVLGLIIPAYFCLFYKYPGVQRLIYKLSFIIVLSVCLTSVFLKRDLCFTQQTKGIRTFAIYLSTGLSLLYLHLRYRHNQVDKYNRALKQPSN